MIFLLNAWKNDLFSPKKVNSPFLEKECLIDLLIYESDYFKK